MLSCKPIKYPNTNMNLRYPFCISIRVFEFISDQNVLKMLSKSNSCESNPISSILKVPNKMWSKGKGVFILFYVEADSNLGHLRDISGENQLPLNIYII